MTADETAADTARRIRENAQRRARRQRLHGGDATGKARQNHGGPGRLASLPPSWSTLRARLGRDEQRVVAVGPAGIVVVTFDSRSDAAVTRAAEAAEVVRRVAGSHAGLVRAILCLVQADPVAGQAAGVEVCSTPTLIETLTQRPAVMSAREVSEVAIRLDVLLRSPTASRRATGATPVPSRRRLVAQIVLAVVVLLALALAAPQMATHVGGALSHPDRPAPTAACPSQSTTGSATSADC